MRMSTSRDPSSKHPARLPRNTYHIHTMQRKKQITPKPKETRPVALVVASEADSANAVAHYETL